MAYIYKITNNITQKSYIGKTEYAPELRWKQHLRSKNYEECSHRALYKALNKYGAENFSFTVLEETDNPSVREQYYIQLYNTYKNGYNETLGGDGASYLILPEDEICNFYQTHTLKETCAEFGNDIKTIRQVLLKNNIPLHSDHKTHTMNCSYAVAQVDPKTNEIIAIYDTVADAELAVNGHQHISEVISGRRKTCKGFKWIKI